MNPEETFPEIKTNYRFECTFCGDCCTGAQKVHLNPYDLYKMAAFLSYENTELLFKKNWLKLIQTQKGVYLPRIRFKRYPFRFCPFLINEESRGLCRLHPSHKPLVCSMAPVGRVVDVAQNRETWHLVPPTPTCRGMHQPVVNALSGFQTEFAQELDWQKRFFRLLERIQLFKWNRDDFLTRLYRMDTTKPFHTQFEYMESSWAEHK